MITPELKDLYEVFAGTECAKPNEQFYIDNDVPDYDEHLAKYNTNQDAINYVNNYVIICIYHDACKELNAIEIAQATTQAVTDGYTINYYDENNESAIIGIK